MSVSSDRGSAQTIVAAYRSALAKGDFASARSFLADDLHFKGPIDEFHRADDYISAVGKLHTIIRSIENAVEFAAGDEVAVFYDMVTKTPAGTAAIAERYRVRGGKIVELRTIFDARPFAAMFEKRA